MPTNTYVELQKVTVGTATNSVTFSSINQGYTDLVIVTDAGASVVSEVDLRVGNSSVDTGSNYSRTVLSGDGSTASSARNSLTYWRPNFNSVYDTANGKSVHIFQFMNYANTNVFKTMLYRGNSAAYGVDASVNLWSSTSAINIITLYANVAGTKNFLAGSTFSLYGIKAWTPEVTPKATGGYVYEDSTYWYHAFLSSGTFTPNQSLTCDYLVIAGGGGSNIGGGGAGGLRSTVGTTGGGGTLESALSVTAQAYAITVGAGGAGTTVGTQTQGSDGSNSVFSTITSIGGGGGGAGNGNGTFNNGRNGGSGGGAHNGGAGRTPGSGTANQGYAGGAVSDGGTGSGGGGAGSVGGDRTVVNTVGGVGGSGVTITALATPTQTGVNGIYATGGAGFPSNGLSGQVATGNGGTAATSGVSGNGGSGLVVIRYAK